MHKEMMTESPDVVKKKAIQCLQAASIACYAYTMAKKATDKAVEARAQANSSSALAHKLTQAVEMLKRNMQMVAGPMVHDSQTLVRLYTAAEKKSISFYKFMTIIRPSEELMYYDKEDDNSEASKCGLQTSTSSESCDAFNLPQLKKIKSMSEAEFSGNILSISEQRRRLKRIKSPQSLSPLLGREDAENVQKKQSPTSSQNSGCCSQMQKYSIKASPSSKSLSTEKSDP